MDGWTENGLIDECIRHTAINGLIDKCIRCTAINGLIDECIRCTAINGLIDLCIRCTAINGLIDECIRCTAIVCIILSLSDLVVKLVRIRKRLKVVLVSLIVCLVMCTQVMHVVIVKRNINLSHTCAHTHTHITHNRNLTFFLKTITMTYLMTH